MSACFDVESESSKLDVRFRAAAKTGFEGREGVKWQMVTRGKVKIAGAKKLRSDSVAIAARKRKAEDSGNDKLMAIAATI